MNYVSSSPICLTVFYFLTPASSPGSIFFPSLGEDPDFSPASREGKKREPERRSCNIMSQIWYYRLIWLRWLQIILVHCEGSHHALSKETTKPIWQCGRHKRIDYLEKGCFQWLLLKIFQSKSFKTDVENNIPFVTGDAEITWSPPRLSLDLYGDNAWLDLGWRNGSCYIDVALCNQAGLTVAFWVAFRESDTRQGLVEFGSGACGLSLIRTQDGEINATIRSLGLKKIWSVSSVKASVGKDVWHHVTLTFNSTEEVHLYINGTRYE